MVQKNFKIEPYFTNFLLFPFLLTQIALASDEAGEEEPISCDSEGMVSHSCL